MYKRWAWSAWCTDSRHIWIKSRVMPWGCCQWVPCRGCSHGTMDRLPSASFVYAPPTVSVCWWQTGSKLTKSHLRNIKPEQAVNPRVVLRHPSLTFHQARRKEVCLQNYQAFLYACTLNLIKMAVCLNYTQKPEWNLNVGLCCVGHMSIVLCSGVYRHDLRDSFNCTVTVPLWYQHRTQHRHCDYYWLEEKQQKPADSLSWLLRFGFIMVGELWGAEFSQVMHREADAPFHILHDVTCNTLYINGAFDSTLLVLYRRCAWSETFPFYHVFGSQ